MVPDTVMVLEGDTPEIVSDPDIGKLMKSVPPEGISYLTNCGICV